MVTVHCTRINPTILVVAPRVAAPYRASAHTAVHEQLSTGHVGRIVRCQEQDSPGNVFWLAPATERDAVGAVLTLYGIGLQVIGERRVDPSRHDRVDPDAHAPQLER